MEDNESKNERDLRNTERLLNNFEKFDSEFKELNTSLQEIVEENLDLEITGINQISSRLERLDALRLDADNLFDRANNTYYISSKGGNSKEVKQMTRGELSSLIARIEEFHQVRLERYDQLMNAAVERGRLMSPIRERLEIVREEIKHYDSLILEAEEKLENEKELLDTELTDVERKYHEALIAAHLDFLADLRNVREPLVEERDKYVAEIDILSNGGMPNYTLIDGELVEKNKLAEKEPEKEPVEEKIEEPEKTEEHEVSDARNNEPILENPTKVDEPSLKNPVTEEIIPVSPMPSETPDILKQMDEDMKETIIPVATRPEELSEEPTEDKKEDKADEVIKEETKVEKKEEKKKEDKDEVVVRGKVVKSELANNKLIRALTFIVAAVTAFLALLGTGKLTKKAVNWAENISQSKKPLDPETTIETATTEPQKTPTTTPSATQNSTVAPTAEPTSAPTAEPTAEPTNVPSSGGSSSDYDTPTAAPTSVPTAEPTAEPTPTPAGEQKETTSVRAGEVTTKEVDNHNGTKTIISTDANGMQTTYIVDSAGNIISTSVEPIPESKKTSIDGHEYTVNPVPEERPSETKPKGGVPISEFQGTDAERANAIDALLNGDPDPSEVFDGAAFGPTR